VCKPRAGASWGARKKAPEVPKHVKVASRYKGSVPRAWLVIFVYFAVVPAPSRQLGLLFSCTRVFIGARRGTLVQADKPASLSSWVDSDSRTKSKRCRSARATTVNPPHHGKRILQSTKQPASSALHASSNATAHVTRTGGTGAGSTKAILTTTPLP